MILLSLSHIGKPEYYRGLSRYLRDAEVVLAEGAGGQPPGKRLEDNELPPEGAWLRRHHTALARLLGLEEQGGWEASVVDERWVLADADTEQVLRYMKDKRTILVDDATKILIRRYERLVAGSAKPDEIARGREEAYRYLIGDLQRIDVHRIDDDLIRMREKVMWQAIKKRLTSGRHKRLALVYGAVHACNLEAKLVKEFDFRLHVSSWHDVLIYELPKESPRDGR